MSNQLSRRTLAKGAAWAVPAVAVAAAAPAMAASPCTEFSFDAGSCRWTGANNAWAYHLSLTICNKCTKGSDISFTIDHLANGSGKRLTGCGTSKLGEPIHIKIPAGQCSEPIFLGDFSSQSSASSIVAYDAEGNVLFTADAPNQTCRDIKNPCV